MLFYICLTYKHQKGHQNLLFIKKVIASLFQHYYSALLLNT